MLEWRATMHRKSSGSGQGGLASTHRVCISQLVADAHVSKPTCEANYAGEHGDDAEEGHWAEESGLAYARGGGDDGEELGYAQDQGEEEDLAAKVLLKGEAGSGKSVALAALAHAMRKHGAVVG